VVRVGFENKEKRNREGSKIYVIIKYPTLCILPYILYAYAICGSYGFAIPSLFEKLGL
jgi:hypothetical protein